MNTLDEIFRHGHYEPPHPVVSVLREAPQPLEIVDLGANVGLFGAFALGRFRDARIVGFEPDEANAEVHERSIREAESVIAGSSSGLLLQPGKGC